MIPQPLFQASRWRTVRLPDLVTQLRDLRPANPREIISTWTEKDVLDGKVVDAWVIIFRTRGCYWARKSGCSMCGYVNDVAIEVSPDDLRAQLDSVLPRHRGEPFVKVYTSGNFFDEREVFPEIRAEMMKALGGRCEKVMVETLSHLVRREPLEEGTRLAQKFEIALGLESANDVVLRHAVNKMWGLREHVRAAELAHEMGATVKSYLLLKPPFLTEGEAIEDAARAAVFAGAFSDTVSLNPMNIHKGTLVERLFYQGAYRPPWLWSVVEVMRRAIPPMGKGARLMSAPTGASTPRGASNCGACDGRVLAAIAKVSADQDLGVFEGLTCACKARWRHEIAFARVMPCAGPLF